MNPSDDTYIFKYKNDNSTENRISGDEANGEEATAYLGGPGKIRTSDLSFIRAAL